jgi:hypothetical protein
MILRHYRAFLVLALLLAWPARAAFHLWVVDEIYSTGDGSVQYIELRALAAGQQFLAGHTLTSGSGPGMRTFDFPSNLPGDTAGKRMLIATTGFAALGLVTPDYVVPNGFFDHPFGTLNFAGADVWNYTGVPDGGALALFRDGTNGDRSPTNFAGVTVNPPRMVNISTRTQVLTGADVLIGGFIIGGSTAKTVVVRARGPSLTGAGVAGALANPQVQLFSGPTQLAFNDDYGTAANLAQLNASGFAPSSPLEAAILTTLAPGPYTAIVTGIAGTTGVAIIEVFEVTGVEIPLINISTRGRVQTGENVMIAGFVIQGGGPQTVVVRARGPSLTAAGVPDVLANPQLQLFSGQTVIAANDDWEQGCPPLSACAAAVQASGMVLTDPNESLVLMTLGPGAYTAIVSGVGATTGVAIVEVFRTQ